jgi:hypothetical protein
MVQLVLKLINFHPDRFLLSPIYSQLLVLLLQLLLLKHKPPAVDVPALLQLHTRLGQLPPQLLHLSHGGECTRHRVVPLENRPIEVLIR